MKFSKILYVFGALLAAGSIAACGDDDPVDGNGGDGEFEFPEDPFNLRRCPEIAEFPQLDIQEGLINASNEVAYLGRSALDKSYARDIVGNIDQDQVVVGQFRRSRDNLPGTGTSISNEKVYYFAEQEGDWVKIGETLTDNNGYFEFEIPAEHQYEPGSHRMLAILAASGACAEVGIHLWPEGTQAVITDIDGTLSANDQEFLTQLFDDVNHTPLKNTQATEMMGAWDGKGFKSLYLTARPNEFRWQTRVWLREEGFPFGPIETAESFVFGESARAYKRRFVELSVGQWAFDYIAAYGNAQSDVDAYEDAGIPKGITYTINEAEGSTGTVGIPGGDFTNHIQAVIVPHADSTN